MCEKTWMVNHPRSRGVLAPLRSRCQRVEFRTPGAELALRWLSAQGIGSAEAARALDVSDGNPGLALRWLRGSGMALHAEVAKDLRDLNAGLASPFDVTQRWGRDEPGLRLNFAAALVRGHSGQQARRGASSGQGGEALALTRKVDLSKLAAWFERANRMRDLLRGPIRPELAILDLLCDWAGAANPDIQQGSR